MPPIPLSGMREPDPGVFSNGKRDQKKTLLGRNWAGFKVMARAMKVKPPIAPSTPARILSDPAGITHREEACLCPLLFSDGQESRKADGQRQNWTRRLVGYSYSVRAWEERGSSKSINEFNANWQSRKPVYIKQSTRINQLWIKLCLPFSWSFWLQ